IHDLPVPDAMPALAGLRPNPRDDPALIYRILNANFRLGGTDNAARVAGFAAGPRPPERPRVRGRQARRARADTRQPRPNDRRPLPTRDSQIAANVLRTRLGAIFAGPDRLRREAATVATKLGITEVAATLRDMVGDPKQSPAARVEALKGLAALKDGQLDEILTRSLHADAAPLRAAALRFAANANPAKAPKLLETALANGTIVEKQAAVPSLADLKGDEIDKLLLDSLIRSMDGKAPPEIQLELSDALNAPSRTMAASLQAAAERNARV